ncbi:MAG: hypothetical protein U0793_31800 [Gemmataceae bacterium]
MSILGPICFRRAYYYCHRCGGLTPWDEEVGLTAKRLTPAAEELTTLAGTLCNSFEEAAAKALPKLAALRLSESTVQRTSEAAGQRLDIRRSPPRPAHLHLIRCSHLLFHLKTLRLHGR